MARHELWVELAHEPGRLAAVAADLATCGATIVHLDTPVPGAAAPHRLVVDVPDDRQPDLLAAATHCGAHLSPPDPTTASGRPLPPNPWGSSDEPTFWYRRVPTLLERYVALDDGDLVRLRHLDRDDADAVKAYHRRCSAEARTRSGLPVTGPLTPEAVNDLLGHQGRGHAAIAAFAGDDLVGLARYDIEPLDPDAEICVGVEDRHQRRGIGTLLVTELAQLARASNIRRLRAVTSAGDDRLPAMLRRAGIKAIPHREGDVVVFECYPTPVMPATA